MISIALNPEITFAAIGALIGVLLTVTTQSLNAYSQRRADRILKTFERRLDVYTDLLVTVDAISVAGERMKSLEGNAELLAVLDNRRTAKEAQDRLDHLNNVLTRDPAPSRQKTAELHQEIRDQQARLQSASESLRAAAPYSQKLLSELEQKYAELELLDAQMRRQIVELQLLTRATRLNPAISRISDKLAKRERLSPEDYQDYVDLAGKQIGVRKQ